MGAADLSRQTVARILRDAAAYRRFREDWRRAQPSTVVPMRVYERFIRFWTAQAHERIYTARRTRLALPRRLP